MALATTSITYPTTGSTTFSLWIDTTPVATITVGPSPTVRLPDGRVLQPNQAATIVVTGVADVWVSLQTDAQTITWRHDGTIPSAALPSATNVSSSRGAILASSASLTESLITSSVPISTGNTISSIANGASATSDLSPSTTSERTSSNQKGVGKGATAGIAIGCLIVGGLIAGVVAWSFWGRRKRPRSRDSGTKALALSAFDKRPSAKIIALESGSLLASPPDSGIPQPLEDKAITGEISTISNSIKNHVQSYYHNGGVDSALLDHEDIVALGPGMPVSVEALSALLESASTREIALRFCIAWVIVSGIQTEQPTSLLPPEVAQCLHDIVTSERRSKAHNFMLSKWRTVTAELLQSKYVRNPFTTTDSRNASVRAAVDTLNNILRPYADPGTRNYERERNLEEIVKRSALFAFTLFSQPGSWDFDWKEEQHVKSADLCIFPALVQIADETGELVRPPRPFNEAVLRRVNARTSLLAAG